MGCGGEFQKACSGATHLDFGQKCGADAVLYFWDSHGTSAELQTCKLTFGRLQEMLTHVKIELIRESENVAR